MSATVLSIATAVPAARLPQSEARDFFMAQPGTDRLTSRLIGAAFDQSAIESRYSVIGSPGDWSPAFVDHDARLRSPTTGARNAVYRRESRALFATAARSALNESGVPRARVTHVITASCTGFFAPGPDFLLTRDLGLSPSVERFHLGFMGCAAAFPALRMAARLCDERPESVVLVVCAEICSIHIRASSDPEQIVASAVFSDGAGAAVVASAAPSASGPRLDIGAFTTTITTTGEADMDWDIGDHGFEMRLTAQVPRIIGREVAEVVADMGLTAETGEPVAAWAVHPGGRSVLDRVQHGLGLSDTSMAHSRAVLRDYGNMSSATILFILRRILHDESLGDAASVASLCFGPGLTVETARFTRHSSRANHGLSEVAAVPGAPRSAIAAATHEGGKTEAITTYGPAR